MSETEKKQQQRLIEIFLGASALHGGELESYLKEQCAGNTELRARVDKMILEQVAADATVVGGIEETGPASSFEGEVGGTLVGSKIGDHLIVSELGRGAMGVVYKATQLTLGRVVALKMILANQLASEQEVKRFQAEAEAAARLDHAGIVPLYEIGKHDEQPYFSMGFIEGETLADRLNEGPLPPQEAASLLRDIADAMAYAHAQHVVHRDLKPANILIDQSGKTKVSDFGLAKRIDADSDLTATGQILGTPSYMAPEQAAGDPDAVGPLADVYALGAILYALLTGRPPFQASNPIDTIMAVLEHEPIPPIQLNDKVPKDLNTICLKCLEKDQKQRYDSATDLRDELDRFLESKPIKARPQSTAVTAWKWMKRHPSLSASLTLATLLLITIAGLSSGMAVQQSRAAKRLRKETDRTKQALKDLSEQEAETAQQAKLAVAGQQRAERALRASTAQRLAVLSQQTRDDFPQRSVLLAREAVETTLRMREPVEPLAETALKDSLNALQGTILSSHSGDLVQFKVSPDENWIAAMSMKQGWVWKLRDDGTVEQTIPLEKEFFSFNDMEFTPDGKFLAVVQSGPNGFSEGNFTGKTSGEMVQLIELDKGDAGRRVIRLQAESPVDQVAVDPTGRWLVAWDFFFTGRSESQVYCWDLTHADPQSTRHTILHPGDTRNAAIDPSGRWLAVSSSDEKLRVWRVDHVFQEAPNVILETPAADLGDLFFSKDGKWLVETGEAVLAWPVSGDAIATQPLRMEGNRAVVGSNSKWLATYRSNTQPDAISKIWLYRLSEFETQSNDKTTPIELVTDQPGRVRSLQFTKSNSDLMVDRSSKILERWSIQGDDEVVRADDLQHANRIRCFGVNPVSPQVVVGVENGDVQVWDLTAKSPVKRREITSGHEGMVLRVLHVNSKRLLSADLAGSVLLTKLDSEQRPAEGTASPAPDPLDPSTNIEGLVTISADKNWAVTTRDLIRLSDGQRFPVTDPVSPQFDMATFCPKSDWLLVKVSFASDAKLWHLPEDQDPVLHELTNVSEASFSRDGHWLTGQRDSEIDFADPEEQVVWDLSQPDKLSEATFVAEQRDPTLFFVPGQPIVITWGQELKGGYGFYSMSTWNFANPNAVEQVNHGKVPFGPGTFARAAPHVSESGRWILATSSGRGLEIMLFERMPDQTIASRGVFKMETPPGAIPRISISHEERWAAITWQGSNIGLIDLHLVAADSKRAFSLLSMPTDGKLSDTQFVGQNSRLASRFSQQGEDQNIIESVVLWRLEDEASRVTPVELATIDPQSEFSFDDQGSSLRFRRDGRSFETAIGIEALLSEAAARVRRTLSEQERLMYDLP
jgi:serine/threonine protein kinase/WD40 repeat protein